MVFGKKLLARDLEVAAAFSKSSGLDAVTKDGDLVNRKGGFEGGYHEERDSRIASLVRLRAATAQVAELEGKESDLKRSAEDVEAALNDLLRELQDLERERDQLSRSTEQAALEITHRRRQIEAAQESVELKSRKLRQLRDDLTAARHQVDVYRAELGTPLHSKLSAAEKEELTTLGERSETLFGELRELEEKVLVIGRQRDGLKADLHTNLLKRLEEARRQLDAVSLKSENAYDNEIGDTVSQIEVSSKSARLYEAELNEIDSSLDKYRHELSTLERDFAQKRQDEEESARTIDAAAKMQDKLLSKRSLLQENIQQKQRQIRDLGTLPRKELEEFRGLSEKPLLGRLKEVQEELKQYAGVNRKALDQYVSFNEQRESLLVRSQQLVRDNASIQQLLSTLDQQKEEAILRTFHDVKGHFADVFKELVPAGEGQLLMGDEVGGEVETQVETPAQMMPGLSGVQIRVSFAGGGQNYDMQQLSGGQKALVALALIFAIQRSDPAPFYLFDEIDQALDANYRASVAGLIRRQAESSESPAQFITTTFRPELVNVADKCYGISLQHKVSSIIPLDKVSKDSLLTALYGF
jgi:structural maintenance of chromosome 3 (chondroitin sulfate proteoglycan 6)